MYPRQKTDKVAAYRALNHVAEKGGVVLFGSTFAAQLPLNELIQNYGISVIGYNRSIESLTIAEAEQYISICVTPLKPQVILLHFGEEELQFGRKTISEMIESYRWLLYRLHTALPSSRLVLVSINEEIPDARQYNQALVLLSQEYGCEYTDGPTGSLDGSYTIRFFHTLHSFFFDRSMAFRDTLRYYSV